MNLQLAMIIVVCATARLTAQTNPKPLYFDVASLKVSSPSSTPPTGLVGGPGTDSPGQITWARASLISLISRAYDLRPYQIAGIPQTMHDTYDIAAKLPAGTTREQLNSMLQSLLVERFALLSRWETKELKIYELVIAPGGSKLREVDAHSDDSAAQLPEPSSVKLSQDKAGLPELPVGTNMLLIISVRGGIRFMARKQPLARLLEGLSRQIDRPVIDSTGLHGRYDFTLTYSGGSASIPKVEVDATQLLGAASEPGYPDLFSAFESQLGLKFLPRNGEVRMLVVDYVRTKPTEN